MASYTLGMAAQATGTAKSTIYRAIKAGRLSGTRTETGEWSIDPAELARVFPLIALSGATPATPDATARERDAMTDILVASLRATIDALTSERDFLRTTLANEQATHAATQVAHAATQAAHATTQRLLPAPVKPVKQGATPAGEDATDAGTTRNRWWRRLAS